MNLNDFRYMRQGQQLHDLNIKDISLLKPLNQRNDSKERALLVLHGFSSSPAVYRYLIPKIKYYDAIVCPALPGHAESINVFAQTKAINWVDSVKEICSSLTQEYHQVDVLGLSLGGLLSCELSKYFPLNHLYLLAPALKLHMNLNLALRAARLFKYLGFVHLRNAAGNILNSDHAEITYRKLPITTIIEMLQLVERFQWQAPTCPTDLFLGAQDLVVNSEAVEQLFKPLSNTNIHWLINSAHVLPLDNDLNDIIKCINSNAEKLSI
jgi:carboxylesterase